MARTCDLGAVSLAKVYVQRDPATGEFINKNVYNAWYGFNKMGVWSESFVISELAAVAAWDTSPARTPSTSGCWRTDARRSSR